MRRISSKMTFYYKRVYPFLFFGFILVFAAMPLISGLSLGQVSTAPFYIAPAIFAVLGYLLIKKFFFGIVDEVFDVENALIIKNGNQEERIPLADIVNVNYSSMFIRPARVTLLLRRPGNFGNEITFAPPGLINFLPFVKSPVVEELIQRIDAARTGSELQPLKVQRNWAAAGLFIVLFFTVISAVIGGVIYVFENSEPYQLSVAKLKSNSDAIRLLGEPISTGIPGGKISINNAVTRAAMDYSVEGPKSKGHVYLDAIKEGQGDWKFNRLELEQENHSERINLNF